MDQKTEIEIIIRVLKGDKQAFAMLVEEYKTPIYNLAYRMTRNSADAEDLAQDTFFRSFNQLSHYDTTRSFYTWLYTISLNLIRNHLKKTGRRRQTNFYQREVPSDVLASDKESEALRETAERDEQLKEKVEKLENCLHKLSPEIRELLVLRFYQGLSFEAIAEITGLSQSAVKMRVYRGLEKLQKDFETM
ncbi:MAG: sigma-70 family RNA polymerase sigma factor [Deltaproteobacteria bacterium]|nr:sigma-70 family RNA polymerase sigma factor [Deltaproteobacteria bacterium]